MAPSSQNQNLSHKFNKAWVCVGALGSAHGVKGDVKVRSFTDDRDGLKSFKTLYLEPDFTPVHLAIKFPNKDGFVASVEGISTREQAMAATGRKLYVKREQLPEPQENNFYITDLVGLKVRDEGGAEVGIIKAVQNFGAGDVLELSLHHARKPVGREPMVPFQEEFVPEVSIDEGFIVVNLGSWLESLKESSPEKEMEQ